ncbi:hypothetical protein [Candidatus Accumulibacter sp. ACC003]|uniref:hypothetical protein n=1 Tax=Candidatus Accumulibacter sp. ACC003 TaxID=2823334 RepID=UPI0025B9B5EF|nr:hypothetical protein [Candidatus Accumulibacter sp. ACC003]
MLLALENAIDALLKSALPSLFTGSGAAVATFSADHWDFDRLSADPIAGEAGPEDAIDELTFDAAAPAGPHSLTRPPYHGPKRVYLRSTSGELVALRGAEVVWDAADPAAFSVVPATGRVLSDYTHLHVMYGVVAAATRLKSLHRLNLQIAGADASSTEKAFALTLSVLVMNREALLRAAAFSWTAGGYQVDGSLKTLRFSSGAAPAAAVRTLALEAEIDLRLERLLG